MNKINTSKAWAIASGRVIMPWSVRSTRTEAITSVVKCFDRSWDVLKRQGNRVVKIQMVPIA